MSYYLGQNTDRVKPITRRTTWTRGLFNQIHTKRYLMQRGRCPINRRGYPVTGRPVAVTGPPNWARFRGLTVGTALPTDMSLEPGQQLGAITFNVPALTTSFSPTAVPAKVAPSTVWNPITSLINLWDSRPQVLKDMRFTVDPNIAMRAAQQVVRPGQVSGYVDWLQSKGVNLNYRGVPVSGPTAGFGYQMAGIDWAGWMPWIIGGGVALVALPMLMGKR